MKKFLFALTACLAFTQSAPAILSNLNESILEINTILENGSIQTTLGQDEFIVDIKRRTKSVSATDVHYIITTRTPRNAVDDSSSDSLELLHHHHHHHHHSHIKKYDVEITITPNPLFGPPIITVISIRQLSSQHHVYFGEETEMN